MDGRKRREPDDPIVVNWKAYHEGSEGWSEAARRIGRAGWRETYEMFAATAPPSGLVLDLGCGPGLDGPGLSERGFRLVGMDLIVAFLRDAARETAFRGVVACGDLLALPYRAETFDGVWADGTLHHVAKAQLPGVLADTRRILRPGGVLFGSVERGTGERLVPASNGVSNPRFYAYYEADEMERALRSAGLEPIEVREMGRSESSEGFLAFTARRAEG